MKNQRKSHISIRDTSKKIFRFYLELSGTYNELNIQEFLLPWKAQPHPNQTTDPPTLWFTIPHLYQTCLYTQLASTQRHGQTAQTKKNLKKLPPEKKFKLFFSSWIFQFQKIYPQDPFLKKISSYKNVKTIFVWAEH